MSSYGELIQALGALKNVKEKRHGIKTLASLCATRAFQVRIVQKGGWKNAILPLIISLDEECRKHAALAIANLSTSTQSHQQLLEEEVLRHLVPMLHSEEVSEVIVYVLNALGNFAVSPIMWDTLREMGTMQTVADTLHHSTMEEVEVNALFYLANATADPVTRSQMMEISIHEMIWEHLQHPRYEVMQFSLAVLRGLSVEPRMQKDLPELGIVPLLVGIFQSHSPHVLKSLSLDIILHISFLKANAHLLLGSEVSACIVAAAKSSDHPEFVVTAVAIIANVCESVELHDRITENEMFGVLKDHVKTDVSMVQQHVIRALMQLSLSPKYHHVILATDVMAKILMVAVSERLPHEMRVNALEMMASVCATHPTAPTEKDVEDLLYLVCDDEPNKPVEIRRAAMMVLANASADLDNMRKIVRKEYVEALVISMSKATDVVLFDYMTQYFHNICKMDQEAGSMLIQCGYGHHMFTYERLEALSVASAIYVCDTCRTLAEDPVVRNHLLERMIFQTMLDAWSVYIEEPHIAPHLALMCSAFAFHSDAHQEFVMQHGVRLVIELYRRSEVEHVRLCCQLTLLYLADHGFSQRAIAQERGLQLLLSACETETHIDLVTNSLKALIPFACSDDYRPQLGMEGGIDTFASFLFSPTLQLQQLGIYLLQNLLELGVNRRIFLGIAEEKKTEEDYLEALVRFLPQIRRAPTTRFSSRKASPDKKKKAAKTEDELTDHDPFVVRCCIHCLALLCLENNDEVRSRFLELQVPQLLFTIFYSKQIDKSSGEAILLLFANLLHSSAPTQAGLLRSLDLIPMLLASNEMGFAPHTTNRCLSAVLSISRTPEFKSRVMQHLEDIMTHVNATISATQKDEHFYCTAALECTLLCELALTAYDSHERMLRAGVMEAFLVFITVAGRGLQDEVCVELLMAATFGISTLASSPTCGEAFTTNLLYPATRLQLFVSLLRLPQEDINRTFHSGTVGLRTLQRTIAPALRPEELHIDNIDSETFFDMCGVRPADFVSRHVVRTLCVILAHRQLGARVQEAISLQNVVPTCLFALRGSNDLFVQVLGYVLVARFSIDPKLQNAFVNNVGIVDEILTTCRRFSPDSATAARQGSQESQAFKLAAFGRGAGQWTVQAVALNKYLLAMIALTSIAERVKERFREGAKVGARTPEDRPEGQKDGQLKFSNHSFLQKLTATCLRDLDAEELLRSDRVEPVLEFTAVIRVIVVHNALMSLILLDHSTGQGGLVPATKVEAAPATKPTKPSQDLVVPELRAEFKSLSVVQAKCDGLLRLAQRCLELETGRLLVTAALECLCALTFLSPRSVKDPAAGLQLLASAPTWVQPSLCCLFANSMAEESRPSTDLYRLVDAESSHLFPLAATAPQETQRYVRGALANCSARREMFDFVINSGILRVYQPVPSRGLFVQEFKILNESVRILANLTCRPQTHADVNTEKVIGFLRDMLRHSSKLLKAGFVRAAKRVEYEFIEAMFGEDDVPPLGMRIRWEQPARIIEIIPGTPAAALENPLCEGDVLIEVNGVDVIDLTQQEISPMFENRPLLLRFQRMYEDAGPEEEAPLSDDDELDIEEIENVAEYGTREQYLECFNLVLLTLHNLATSQQNHARILGEPKILKILLDLVPSDVLVPSLRRLVFSLLACLCQQREIAGRVFHVMSSYYMDCEQADLSLQRYIVLAANLHYTGLERVDPDRTMLVFVGQMAAIDGMTTANQAIVEILHRMSMGPKDLRGPFICRETLVLTVQFVDMTELWEVQCRAFEVSYFLTIGTLNPTLWASVDLLPHMIKGAAHVRQSAVLQQDQTLVLHEDALWELTLRTCYLCLGNPILVRQMNLSELDRYLMDLFMDTSKPSTLVDCAGHVMSGLLKTELAGSFWSRWKGMGIGDKFVTWFGTMKDLRAARSQQGKESAEAIGLGIDSVFHLLLCAVELDPPLLSMLGAGEVVSCIGARLLDHTNFYCRIHAPGAAQGTESRTTADDIRRTDIAFRGIVQLLSLLAVNGNALSAMSRLNLPLPLLQLVGFPPEDFREPTLIALCALCAHKGPCGTLMKSPDFKKILLQIEKRLDDTDTSPLDPVEVEFYTCIMDRSCCHADVADIVQADQFHLLSSLVVKSQTVDSQLMALRALCNCSLLPSAVRSLYNLSQKDLPNLHYLMALNGCLRSDVESGESMVAMARRAMVAGIAETGSNHPHEAKLVNHFSQVLFCEAVSVSRAVCATAMDELDFAGLVARMNMSLRAACQRIDEGGERMDLVSAELLNTLVSSLHIVLGVLFRGVDQNVMDLDDQRPRTVKVRKTIVQALLNLLEEVYAWLRVDILEAPPSAEEADTATTISMRLHMDLRVLFFLSAILREICARPMHSIFLDVVRTKCYHKCLEAVAKLVKRRFSHMVAGTLVADPYSGLGPPGSAVPPLLKHYDDLSLAMVFEHLLVCLRHQLVQAMHVAAPLIDVEARESWCWGSQEQLQIHEDAALWIPDVAMRFGKECRGIMVETVRYICAVATFYVSPMAAAEDGHKLCRVFAITNGNVLRTLVGVLEVDRDPCSLCLACLTIANLASYELEDITRDARDQGLEATLQRVPVPDLVALVQALSNTLQLAPDLPRRLAIKMVHDILHTVVNLLAFKEPTLTLSIFESNFLDVLQSTFKEYFRDVYKIESDEEYTAILQQMVLLLRNWVTIGFMMWADFEKLLATPGAGSPTKAELANHESMHKHLDAPKLINILIAVVWKLADTPRKIPNKTAVLNGIFEETLIILQTLLCRQGTLKTFDWEKLKQDSFETLLATMLEHRQQQSGSQDDFLIVNILYLLTQLGIPYSRTHFPDYLMNVAYGPRAEHATIQDIAAVSCAVISSQNSKGRRNAGASCSIADVVESCSGFINSLAQVADPRMRLWHFRTITLWSQRPKVLTEVSEDEQALRYIASQLIDDLLGRYSIIFLHNITVLRWPPVLRAHGCISLACQAYRLHGEVRTPGGETERRLLRHLLIGSIRNCFAGSASLDEDLSDGDLEAVVHMADCIEEIDLPLYLCILLHACDRVAQHRVATCFPNHTPLVDLLVRIVFEQTGVRGATPLVPVSSDADLYGFAAPVDASRPEPAANETEAILQEEAEESEEDEDEQVMAPIHPSVPSTPVKGLGKKPSLYTRSRRPKPAAESAAAKARPKEASAEAMVELRRQQSQASEYAYFAAAEVLMYTTFHSRHEVQEAAEGAGPTAVEQAVAAAFDNHSFISWLRYLGSQVESYENKKLVLSPLFVQVSAKFLWHCWAVTAFRVLIDTAPDNLKLIAMLTPFFLSWRKGDVRNMLADVCVYAPMYRSSTVCQYFVEHHARFSELACSLLTFAFSDDDANFTLEQATAYLGVFVKLLRNRCISRAGLQRMCVSLMTTLLADHPKGLCAMLLHKEHRLLADLLESLGAYVESGTVRRCMTVMLALTVGQHYRLNSELDLFALRVLDLAPTLLENEFTLFMPVLQCLAERGGKRLQGPIIGKQLHLRIARLLEHDASVLETSRRAGEHIQNEAGPRLNVTQRIQWALIFFATLGAPSSVDSNVASDGHDNDDGRTVLADNLHFDTFVCVDLLPCLVRILRAVPQPLEAYCIGFLISSVVHSPAIVPHMPTILGCVQQAFPALLSTRMSSGIPVIAPGQSSAWLTESVEAAGSWRHVGLPHADRITIAMRRNLLNLLSYASFLPPLNPALLGAQEVFQFVKGLDCERNTFEEQSAPLQCKLFCLANMCSESNPEVQQRLFEQEILEVLEATSQQLAGNRALLSQIFGVGSRQSCDLQLLWLHAILSLCRHSAPKVVSPVGLQCLLRAIGMAEELLRDRHKYQPALGLILQCQQALSVWVTPLSTRLEFGHETRQQCCLFLLGLICSAPLLSLRLAACDYLIDVIPKGYNAEVFGAVLLRTPCAESFKRLICGPLDDLAASIARMMIAFVLHCGYEVHVHLLQNLDAVVVMLGDPRVSPVRILWLAELFVVLTRERTYEVLDVMAEVSSITAFLSLARSQQTRRRELVQQWLEVWGSSLYEIDEVSASFDKSTLLGLLLVAERCTLPPSDARTLRRLLFGVILGRVETWRGTVFGPGEFLNGALVEGMLPMCQLQPDLSAAVIALFHSFVSRGEVTLVERLWEGGHFPWLYRQLQHRSTAQFAAMRAAGVTIGKEMGPTTKAWERHLDLIVAQGMAMRLVLEIYAAHPVDASAKIVASGDSVPVFHDFLSYYWHFDWPEANTSRDIVQATEGIVLTTMGFIAQVIADVDYGMKQTLIQQGILGLCLTVMLPTPPEQAAAHEAMKLARPDEEAAVPAEAEEESLPFPEAKMIAGAAVAKLLHVKLAYDIITEKKYADMSVGMFSFLYHWRTQLLQRQGQVAETSTVSLVERLATVFVDLLSGFHLDWLVPHLGIGSLEVLASLFLELWSHHANVLIQHHSLRLVASFTQIQVLYVSLLAHEQKATALKEAVYRSFGLWDVRELRHVLRLLCAGLAHALEISILPGEVSIGVDKGMKLDDAHRVRELMDRGGVLRANQAAADSLLTKPFFAEVLKRCETQRKGPHQDIGDTYGRVWSLWMLLTILGHPAEGQEGQPDLLPADGVDSILYFAAAVDVGKLDRRASLLAEQTGAKSGSLAVSGQSFQAEVEPVKSGKLDGTGKALALGKEDQPPTCHTMWLKNSNELCLCIAQMIGKCIALPWRESQQVGTLAAARGFTELPHYLETAIFTIQEEALMKCLSQPEKNIQLGSLLLCAILSSIRLPLRPQTLSRDFLKRFHDLQQEVIEGAARSGDGPYYTLASWLRRGLYGTACEVEFRGLIAFIIGQALCPPFATVPSLNVDAAEAGERAPGGRMQNGDGADPSNIPVVAQCPPPPQALLDRLAQEVLQEDLRLRQAQTPPPRNEGPHYSTILCHLLYAVATMVSVHPKAAATSASVRGAAFAQLMKVQSIVARSLRMDQLLDTSDGSRAKLFMYSRAIACVRAALQTIMGSWFAADYGAQFVVTEEGGSDFVQYCTKHIIQVYNNKIALTRVLGTPWERIMLTQGPTSTIAELLLVLCSSDANLREVGRLGGQQALHSLSRYADTMQMRQQATMLLTKLAVLEAPKRRVT